MAECIEQYQNLHLNIYYFFDFFCFLSFFVYFTDDESDGVEMGRSSSELSNLNEDWDSGK